MDILSRPVFVIMDKNRKFIVQHDSGKYKHKYLTTTAQTHGRDKEVLRIFYYDTEGRAFSGMKSNITWIEDLVHEYPELAKPHLANHNESAHKKWIEKMHSYLEVVPVNLKIEI